MRKQSYWSPSTAPTLYSVAKSSNIEFSSLISHCPMEGSQFTAKEAEAHGSEKVYSRQHLLVIKPGLQFGLVLSLKL